MSTADNLLTALALFTMEAPEWSVEGAAASLGVSGSTAYRYFSSLAKAGLLEQSTGGRYVLGPAVIALDRQLRLQDRLIRAADVTMRRLIKRNDGQGVTLLCRRFRQQVMCIHEVFENRPANAVSYERGRPMGLYRGAASLTILAHLPVKTLRELWARDWELMKDTLGASWEEARQTLKTIRKEGVLVTHAHLDPGVVGIAAPIFDPERKSVHAISLVVAEGSATSSELAGLQGLVQAAAREITGACKED
ncbi:IclR family transcriptional regulator [Sphingomonas sp. SRS2]|uniref:IclR family transcriptional regulator n=1 Tax=Sphingomonas sp. SRS2 TaxID=133190 RepID=UPI0006183EBE|nr:IclR family transcriptional regulator C-terminal domain-containing protein [Sphingomonas sp. SRS2]KKC26638.1 hypothetical protein WP12_06700 [Sphingomonas sp. SRS2]